MWSSCRSTSPSPCTCPVPPSFTDDGPLTAMLVSVAATFTIVTDCDAVRVTPPLV